jgi:ferredoxin-NADP reductase
MIADAIAETEERLDRQLDGLIDVHVTAVHDGAHDTNLYELRRIDDGLLPSVDPGAHVDLHLPNGLIRQYSLLAAEYHPQTYSIGVKRDENSRGGSHYIHDNVRPGYRLKISKPRNNFPLNEQASHSVFIAGGIGITPIWCMLNRLNALGRSWKLFYSCRSARYAVFLDRLAKFPEVEFHFDDENDGRVLDLPAIVRNAPKDAQLYCCGPLPMLAAFEAATAGGWHRDQLHVEYFSPKPSDRAETSFVVVLARSGREVAVPADRSILIALREAGFNLAYSCEQGICGTCETGVLAGTPDHRDAVLTEEERAQNSRMMICCSRSLTDRLVLDL